VISTISEHGNTSAASVPLALTAAVQDGPNQAGDLVLMEAMGAASPGAPPWCGGSSRAPFTVS
jgi:3-oxoacyl-[acyl-carrier-protein] synthase-3